jgi:glycosyltransferase involved in cell wall biosynthesis
MVELAEELQHRGHEITVLTSYPQYNLDTSEAIQCYDERMDENGIAVIRVRTLPHHNVNFVMRGIAQVTMPRIFLRALRRNRAGRFDVVLVYSPPLTLAAVGSILKRRTGARFVLNVQDIFPQNAIDLGALKNPLLIRWFEKMEYRAYTAADIVTVHSEGNRSFVEQKERVDNLTKLRILHNWIDVQAIENADRSRNFRQEYGLEGKFVLLFAGVIGPSQGLDMVLDVAERVADLKDLVFLIVGDGMEKKRLQERVETAGLTNIVFKPFVSKDAYASLVNSVDGGIVSLTAKKKTPVVPGKILGYMAAAKPVLAFLNQESDGHALIDAARCGVSVPSGQPVSELERVTRELYNRRAHLETMGQNGKEYVTRNFDKKVCIDTLEQFLQPSRQH